jgi:uncharacterized protein (TIGR00255 family)
LRELLTERVARGRLELATELRWTGERQATVELNRGVLRELRQIGRDLAADGLADGELRLGDLLRLPEVLTIRAQPLEVNAQTADLLQRLVREALDGLLAEREREGTQVAAALGRRLDRLEELIDVLGRRRAEVELQLATALRERTRAMLADVELPEERLLQEVALALDRSDISEELDRLAAHLAGCRAALLEDGAVGKRLDFLAQEISRELNTLGAKCRDPRMSAWMVEGKLVCEQLREQVQNIE